MQYPEYISEVKKRVETLRKDGNLENWVLQYAREISLDNRELFLGSLVYHEQNDTEVLSEFNAFIREIEDDTYYMEVDFEVYHSWYDDEDTYIDIFSIGPTLEKYYRIAEEYVSEGKLKIAYEILQKLNTVSIGAGEDRTSVNDYERLSLYYHCTYHLCSIPYDAFCDLTIYVSYMVSEEELRPQKVAHDLVAYEYSDEPLMHLFEKTGMSDAEKNTFLEGMIAYLGQSSVFCDGMRMHNFLLMRYGKEGILQAARDLITQYPGIVKNEMKALLLAGEYERVYAYACDYLERIPDDKKERLDYIQMIAECAFHLSKEEEERKALEEIFVHMYSDSSAFALLTRFDVSDEEMHALMERIKPAEKPLYFGGEKADTSVYVSLLMGNIEPALQLLTGGKHVMDADMLYDLLLLKIIEDEDKPKVYQKLCANIQSLYIAYDDIQHSIANWKKFHPSDMFEKQYIFDELLPYADKEAREILDARDNKRYHHAVRILTGIAEAGVILGKFATAGAFLDTYRNYYPRLRSFHNQLKEAGY